MAAPVPSEPAPAPVAAPTDGSSPPPQAADGGAPPAEPPAVAEPPAAGEGARSGGSAAQPGALGAEPPAGLLPALAAEQSAPAGDVPLAAQAPTTPLADAGSRVELPPAAAPPPAAVPVSPTAAPPGAGVQAAAARRNLAAIEADDAAEPPPAQRGPGCLLGELCFGPVLTLGVLDVLGFGGQARTDHWGIGIDYQFIHFSTQDIPITLSLLTVEGRLYPFGGSFFVAAGLAWQHATLSGHVTYRGDSSMPPVDAQLSGKINVPVLKLGLGWFGRSGFVVGFDVAFGIQLGRNTVSFSTDLPRVDEVVQTEQKIRDRADAWVRALPFLLQLNLIRIGFLF